MIVWIFHILIMYQKSIFRGALKLTHRMEERDHTQIELFKLDKVKAYLQDKGLYNETDFTILET